LCGKQLEIANGLIANHQSSILCTNVFMGAMAVEFIREAETQT